jgi:XTP/dITP diphosphohydrolase
MINKSNNSELLPECNDKKLVIASHNKGKVVEITALLAPLGFAVSSAADYALTEPDETEETFEGNALIKARFVHQQTKHSALADDSGLVIPALNGAPGVYSARFAGPTGDFNVAFEKLESMIKPGMDTSAHFVCALAFVDDDGAEHVFTGTCHGHIQFPPKGISGFGYDPIFIPNGETRTFGEMAYGEKQNYSHRSHAFELFKAFLSEHSY